MLRVVVGFASYSSKTNEISKENNEWYKNLAKCESIIIEKGDVECYDTFFHMTQKYEGCGIITLREQILPSIIMANKYNYSKACQDVLYRTTLSPYSMGLHSKIAAREKYALYWGLFFTKRGISLRDEGCLRDYARLMSESGFFSVEDSIFGEEIYDLLDKNRNNSVDIWKEYKKL